MQTLLSILQIPTSIFLSTTVVFYVHAAWKNKEKDRYTMAGDMITGAFLLSALALIWR